MQNIITTALLVGSAWVIGSIPVALLIGGMIRLREENNILPQSADEPVETQQYINQ